MDDLEQITSLVQLKELYGNKLPNHVGLILDGNRRWIKQQGLADTLKGHKAGYKTLRKILYPFFEAGVTYLSIYALSSENVRKRSAKEVKYLFKLLLTGIEDVLKEPLIHEKKVQVKVIGRLNELPQDIQHAIEHMNKATAHYNGCFINVCINYDGQEEIVDAVKSIVSQGLPVEKINKQVLKEHLYTNKFPEADYIIRTGMTDGARISGFLVWDSSYAEYRFRNELWPEYNEKMLLEDLIEYVKRNRRKGK
ncbi:polyprenyl diphosphate synthase [Candidatus Lokiarchaeum ossiferum]|uniref:polyprenyl diphosphate synthase n=1 Tax=Candidatus Lokiarchaeum ossiferum TaxID=2951803 RepID=UPI00352C33EF